MHQLTIWGNHSATQYPDLSHALVAGKPAAERASTTTPGSPTPSSRPSPSAARRSSRRAVRPRPPRPPTPRSTTSTAGCNGTPDGDWTSAAIVSDGSYGVPEGLISSFPVTSSGRRLGDRPGPGDRRLLPRPDRRLGRRARRGARRGPGPRPRLTLGRHPYTRDLTTDPTYEEQSPWRRSRCRTRSSRSTATR